MMQQSIEATNALVDALVAEAGVEQERSSLSAWVLEGLRPIGDDLPFAILDKDSKHPLGIAKLTIREDEPEVTGHLGIYFLDANEPLVRVERIRRVSLYIEAAQLLARVAFTECALPRVFLYEPRQEIRRIRALEEHGFIRTGSKQAPFVAEPVEMFVYEKRLG